MKLTAKQQERIRLKIKKLKAALAADKKEWGGYYHDGNGIRYSIPSLYIKLEDYSGGLRYLNWFKKNFPDDMGYPDFLFEWTVILFKTKRLKDAEKKAFQTFCRNTYIFDRFFDKPIKHINKWEGSNFETSEYTEKYFEYAARQDDLIDFAGWLEQFILSKTFLDLSKKYIKIHEQLYHEQDLKTRRSLIKKASQLESKI